MCVDEQTNTTYTNIYSTLYTYGPTHANYSLNFRRLIPFYSLRVIV